MALHNHIVFDKVQIKNLIDQWMELGNIEQAKELSKFYVKL